jgi:hypothetical protein
MLQIGIRVLYGVVFPLPGWSWDVTNRYQRKRCLLSGISRPVGGQGYYNKGVARPSEVSLS